MSRSVRTLASTCSRVPHGTVATRFHPLKESVWLLGENALSCEILRWLFHCCLMNTVAFLPLTLRQGTHRNALQFSRCYEEYIILTCTCQGIILRAWASNQNKPPCGLPSKICRPLRVSGNCTAVSQIRRQCGWPCKLWHSKSNLHLSPLPQGTPIDPPDESRGLSGPLIVICFSPHLTEKGLIMRMDFSHC